MSIASPLAALEAVANALGILIWIALGAMALFLAWRAHVQRPEGVVGPVRLRSRDMIAPLWLVTGAATFFWLTVPFVLLRATGGIPTNGPATEPITMRLTPAQTTTLALGAPIIGFLTICIFAIATLGRRIFRDLGFSLADLVRSFKPGAIAAAIVLPLMIWANFLSGLFWRLVGHQHPNEHDLLRALGSSSSPAMRIGIVFSAIIATPIFEELLFRGCLQTALVVSLSRSEEAARQPRIRWIAIIFTSLTFALFHGALWMMPPIFFLALCLGYAYERTGTLWVSILIHASFNTMSIIYFLLTRSAG